MVLAQACSQEVERNARPAGVPADACWVGGPDGGVYVKLTRVSGAPPDVVTGEVYEETGVRLYGGPLQMEPSGRPLQQLDNPKLFTGWDGERLHLTDGRALRATSAGSAQSPTSPSGRSR
jgi:hypothetical protein